MHAHLYFIISYIIYISHMCMKFAAPSYPYFTNGEVCSHTIIFTHTQNNASKACKSLIIYAPS